MARSLTAIITDDLGSVLACGPGERGMTGFRCHDYPHYEEPAARTGLIIPAETLYICWPGSEHNTIVRSIVISDELWTLSYRSGYSYEGDGARLQVNGLNSLERLAQLHLGNQADGQS